MKTARGLILVALLAQALAAERAWAQEGKLTVTDISPRVIDATSERTVLRISGSGLAEAAVLVGTRRLVDADNTDRRITGVAPPLGDGEPAGPRDVTVTDGVDTVVIPDGVEYYFPARVDSMVPEVCSYLGHTSFRITGSNFHDDMHVRIGDTVLSADQLTITSTTIRGTIPAVAVTVVDLTVPVQVEDPKFGQEIQAGDGLRYVGPLELESITPGEVVEDALPLFMVNGKAFTEQTAFALLGADSVNYPMTLEEFRSASSVVLGMGDLRPSPGVYDLQASDEASDGSRVTVKLDAALTILGASSPPVVESFSPEETSYLGGESFSITGSNFSASPIVLIGGEAVTGRVFGGILTGVVPPHSPTPDRVDVVVRNSDGSGEATLPGAVQFIGPLRITSIDPPVVAANRTNVLTITGEGFNQTCQVLVGTHLSTIQSVSLYAIVVTAPVLPPGELDVRVRGMAGTRPEESGPMPLRILEPPEILSVEPSEVSYLGGEVLVRGSGFRDDLLVRAMNFEEIKIDFAVDPARQEVRIQMPSHTAGQRIDIEVTDPLTGLQDRARDAVETIGPLALTAIQPSEIEAAVAAQGVRVTGAGFTPRAQLRIGTSEWLPATRSIDVRTAEFTLPALAEGVYDVELRDFSALGGAVAAPPLVNGLTVREPDPGEPAVVESIEPYDVAGRGVTPIVIHGRNFHETMQLFVDGPQETPIPYELVSETEARATAPAHAGGIVDIVARSESGTEVITQDVARYDTPALPGLQQVEGTVVDGVVQVDWVNIVDYEEIHVYRDGRFHLTLPGHTFSFTDPDPAPGGQVSYGLVGQTDDDRSVITEVDVSNLFCDIPASHGTADRGPEDFFLVADHAPYDPDAGEGGVQGGGDGRQVSVNNFSNQLEPVVYDHSSGKAGFAAKSDFDDMTAFIRAPNELLSGFTLFETATKLRIEVHGARVQAGFGTSLRVRIERVPTQEGDPERVVELAMPDEFVDPEHEWIDLTYNTLKPPPPPGEDPDGPPVAPHPPLPPGDYLVRLYVVGGQRGQIYYTISSDFNPDQILVPGVGCPPYPLIRVTDTSGENSRPVIYGIEQYEALIGSTKYQDDNGYWIHAINAKLRGLVDDPDGDPIVQYKWTVHTGNLNPNSFDPDERLGIVRLPATGANSLTFEFENYGYYLVDLEVKDSRCATSARTFVVKIHPPCVEPPAGSGPNFSFPTPRPNDAHFLTDLPGGLDSFPARVPTRFTTFVVDSKLPGQIGDPCDLPARTRRVQFALYFNNTPLTWTNGDPALVEGCLLQIHTQFGTECCIDPLTGRDVNNPTDANPCAVQDESGARFWTAIFPDMRKLAPIRDQNNRIVPNATAQIRLMGRASPTINLPIWGPFKPVQLHGSFGNPNGPLVAIPNSEKMTIYNKPAFLGAGEHYVTGGYIPSMRKYYFHVQQQAPNSTDVTFPPTATFSLGVGGEMFPSLANDIQTANQGVSCHFSRGRWALDDHRVSLESTAMSLNTGQVSKLLLSGVPVEKAAGVQSSHDPFETFEQLLEYEYCESIELFRRKTTVPIFSAVIYNGPLPPPVFWITVSASATFELTVAMVAHLQARLRGLPQNGENMFESDFFIDPSVTAGLNAEGSADLALGIVSFDLGANFDADFHMPFKIGVSENGVAGPEFGLCLHMMLEFYFDVCLSFFGLFDIACYGDDWDVWNDWLVGENDPICQALQADSCGQPNPKGLDPGDGGVAGGPIEPAPLNAPGNQLAIASSPDGEYQVAIGRLVNVGHGDRLDIVVRKKGGAWRWPPVAFIKPDNDLGMVREPSVVFTNNQQIALAWAQDFAWEDPTLQSGDESTMAGFNKIMRRYDVMFRLASLTEDPDGDIHLSFDSLPQRLSDDPINGDYHGDGRVCLARVPESGGLVWATWVRFETPDVLIPINPPLPNPVGEDYPDLTSRIHLRQTSIFARRIFGGTTQGPMMRVSNVDNFIDLQPDVTASPDGDVMIVWLNDSLHDDLTYQNDGRNILYSILGPGDVWTAPAPVLGNTADLPAILEPEIALGDDGRGMLVFSAAPAGASEFDSGLGTNRVLYTVKVSGVPDNPVWEEPVLVFRECETPIFARLYDIVHPETDHPEVEVEIEFGLVVNDIGAFGSRLGAGGMSVLVHNEAQSQWSQPINLTADDRVHQNGVVAFTGTEVVMINESPAVWSQGVARAPGGLQAESSTELFGTIQVGSFDAVADPAIMYCRIPGTHASPGTTIEAIVGVTNRGFARTPGGQDSLSLRVFYVSGGESTEIRSQPLPPLMPGDELFHSFELTMPRQPVRIVVEVDGVEGEMNPSDNVRDCPLGTQPPRDLQSRCFESSNGRLAVRLNWTNTGIYDAILIYRDGIQVTEIPGTEVSWVDYGTPAGIQDFHEYCVRGRFAQSLSTKAATLFENTCLDGVDPKPQFRRGDANLDGFVDISDAIGILAYQFLGTFDLRCPDSGDVNDDAVIDISDPVALLSFQFLGTAPPPAPGPDACGVDPTDDALEPCVSECR